MAFNTGLYRNDSPANMHSDGNRIRETDPEVVAGIIEEVVEGSAVLSLADVSRTNSRETIFTLSDGEPDAFLIKGTTAAGDVLSGNPSDGSRAAKDVALKQTTSMSFRQMKMEAEEWAVLVPLPDTWKADSNVDFGEIRPKIVRAIQRKLDKAVLFGDDLPASWAANGFHGVLIDALAAGNSVNAVDPQYEDLADAIAAMAEEMAEGGYDPSGFVTYPGFHWKLVRLRSADGVPIYSALPDSPQGKGIYGRALTEVKNGAWNDHKADALMIAGEWNNLKVKIRQDFEFTVSNSATIVDTSGNVLLSAFQQDTQVLRVTFRAAAGVVNPNKVLGGEYPFSVLRPDSDYSS